jgi:hypothetical protein
MTGLLDAVGLSEEERLAAWLGSVAPQATGFRKYERGGAGKNLDKPKQGGFKIQCMGNYRGPRQSPLFTGFICDLRVCSLNFPLPRKGQREIKSRLLDG